MGDTVVFVLDKNAASGNGHMGMFYQDGGGKWNYSTQGGAGGKGSISLLSGSDDQGGQQSISLDNFNVSIPVLDASGNPILDQSGNVITQTVNYQLKTEQDVKDFMKTNVGQAVLGYKYTESLTMNTTSAQDAQISSNVNYYSRKYRRGTLEYNLYFQNCVDACQDNVQRKTGINLPLDTNPKPNEYWKDLKKGVDWINLPQSVKDQRIKALQEKHKAEMFIGPKF